MRFNIQEFRDAFPWAAIPCQVIDQSDVYFGYYIDNVYEFDTDPDNPYVKVIVVDDDGNKFVHPELDCLLSETVFMRFVPVPYKEMTEATPRINVQTVKVVDGQPVGNWEPMPRG